MMVAVPISNTTMVRMVCAPYAPYIAVYVHRPRPRAGPLGLLGLGRAALALAHRCRQPSSPRARPLVPDPRQPSALRSVTARPALELRHLGPRHGGQERFGVAVRPVW